jgi:hypothetical protein
MAPRGRIPASPASPSLSATLSSQSCFRTLRFLPVLALALAGALSARAQDLGSDHAQSNSERTQASAENPQVDGYGGGVLASTLDHAAPQPKVYLTDSPRKPKESVEDESVQRDLSGRPTPEGIHDDFDNSNPTAWLVYTGQTAAQVSSLVSSGYRIIDIEVDSSSPYSFTVTLVQNTGAYAKSWWWYYGATVAQVSSYITANNARLISVKAYDIGGGQIRYAAVMVANTGVDAKEWWWYVGESISGISSTLTANKARLIAVDPYVTGGKTYYSAIEIANSGADADSWWWYINATPNTISNAVTQNKARIIYFTPGTSGTFNAIMEGCSSGCADWWYYYGATASQMVDTAVQNGARLVNFSRYAGCGSYCFTGAMINNSNAITTRVGNIIRNGVSGTEGLYLKQVGGPVLASLEDGVVYEPASSIKVVANLYATNQVQKGLISLTTPITHYTNGPDSCPNPPVVSGTETLGLALREMMFHSDNARTREITDHFTDASINSYAKSIGMANTSFNHYVGCGGPVPDTLTLDDAALLYEGVANQSLLNAKYRGVFYSNMAGRAQYESEGYDWTGLWSTDIPNIINQVAPAGTTAAQKAAYQSEMNLAYKAGSYILCPNNNCNTISEDISITGWFQLPVCTASATTYAEYVFGIYFSKEPYSNWTSSSVTPTENDFTAAKGELLREQIQAGMASCAGKTFHVMAYSPSDLVFATTNVHTTTAAKTITLTNNQSNIMSGLSISDFGDFAQTNNCGTSLAPGKSCTISVKFTPTVAGERTGAVIVTDVGTGQPQTIQLTGTGQ